ncbi:hypothetical protein NXW09_29360 [Bacteroides ovatus]|nr:hypothetical protein [Bacteroides ovatus]
MPSRIQHRILSPRPPPEVMLARGTDIFDSRPRNDGMVVVMADKDLVERRGIISWQAVPFPKVAKHALLIPSWSVEEVLRFSGKRFRSKFRPSFSGKRAVFRKIAHYMESESSIPGGTGSGTHP